MPLRLGSALLIALFALSASGCYELQAAAGQARLMWRRRPIESVVADPATAPPLRRKLREVGQILAFANRELDLRDGGSYRSYVALDRPYVVWNVVAAPVFSLRPKRWCYWFVGCMAYRGYFERRRAYAHAASLRAEGLDVSVQGVAAYSTLGHFDDPVLSSMMGWSDVDLAAIVFHELTHRRLFVANDTAFDEGLATFVEREGVRRWLLAGGRGPDLKAFEREQRRYARVYALIRATRVALARTYAAPLPAPQKLAQKRTEFAALRAAYAKLAASWGTAAPFAGWFRDDLNNADLASVATYERCVPGFAREFAAADRRFPAFFRRVRALAALPRARRDAVVCVQAPAV
ncbi:MAG: aminopeptidase [Gammaproteobacteria bacterium]|nr:aminopeptidase [Gammaproteobacteria bacterium]